MAVAEPGRAATARRKMKGGEKTASKLRAVNKIGRAPLAAVRTDARAQDCVFMEEATIRGAENVQSWPLCKRLEDSGA